MISCTNYLSAIVSRADVIVFEDLKVGAMVKNHNLAKSILDASWGKLLRYTSYKASSAGKTVELVPPGGTTVNCSRCGTAVAKSLSETVHRCPTCNLIIGQRLERGNQHQEQGRRGHRQSYACGDETSTSHEASFVSEAGSPRISVGGCHSLDFSILSIFSSVSRWQELPPTRRESPRAPRSTLA